MEDWRRLEKDMARKLQGELTIGSGNKWQKGDVWSREFLAEGKWRSPYLDLKEEWITTTIKHAEKKSKEPVVAICCANAWTLVLVQYIYWENHPYKLNGDVSGEINLTGKKQVRLKADEDYRYTKFIFGDCGEWIALPWDDVIFMVRESSQKENKCLKSKKQKSEAQIEREKQQKESLKQRRKAHYQEKKKQDKLKRLERLGKL